MTGLFCILFECGGELLHSCSGRDTRSGLRTSRDAIGVETTPQPRLGCRWAKGILVPERESLTIRLRFVRMRSPARNHDAAFCVCPRYIAASPRCSVCPDVGGVAR